MNTETSMAEHEAEQIRRAKESGRTPVVFVHGLWLLPSSWDRWAAFFEEDDFVALTPGWPDDPLTVEEAKAHPEVFAGKSIGDVAAHYESIITQLDHTPVIIGHSFGGLITQILAGRGLSAAAVAIDPAPFRGVLPLPISVAARRPSGARQSRRTATRRSRSPTSSSATRSPTPSTRTRPKPCMRSSRCRRPPSRFSRPRRAT